MRSGAPSVKVKNRTSFWDFEHWGDGATEEHHIGRRKFSEETIIDPKSPASRADPPANGGTPAGRCRTLTIRSSRKGGSTSVYATCTRPSLTAHGMVAERMLEAARRGERDLKAVHIPEWLLGWLSRIAHDVAQAADRGVRESDKG